MDDPDTLVDEIIINDDIFDALISTPDENVRKLIL